jgi:hypothetical protein
VATWPTTSGRPSPFSVTGRGQKGKLPLAESPGLGHGRARELGLRASSAARPSHPRAWPRRVPVGVVRRGSEGKRRRRRKERDQRMGPTRQREKGKEREHRLVGLRCLAACWARLGRRADLGSCWSELEVKVFELVLKLELIYCWIQIQTSHS